MGVLNIWGLGGMNIGGEDYSLWSPKPNEYGPSSKVLGGSRNEVV